MDETVDYLRRTLLRANARVPHYPLAYAAKLAECAAQYYVHNSKHLTHTTLWDIQPYLSSETRATLEDVLRSPEPSHLPQEEAEVLAWFISEYLPYRRWQANNGDENAAGAGCSTSPKPSRAGMERYPHWLLQPAWISFQHSAQLLQSAKEGLRSRYASFQMAYPPGMPRSWQIRYPPEQSG